MRYAIVFGLLALGLLGSATLAWSEGGWWLAVIEGYLAIGLLGLALAYAGKQAGWPVEEVAKSPRWVWPLHFLLTPYRLLAWSSLAGMRHWERRGGMSGVGPRLFLGRIPTKTERSQLAERGVGAVLNLCAEFRVRPSSPGLIELHVPILDGSPPTDRQFREAIDWVEARRAGGVSVLIHCAQGHGRSATMAMVVLCRLGLASNLNEALAQIQAVRPRARPSKSQFRAASRFLAKVIPVNNAKGAGLATAPPV